MPYAAVVTVKLQAQDNTQGEKMLREVLIPRLKGLTGFKAARFLRSQDGATGIGSAIFDTEANAKAALDAMTTDRPAEAPPIESAVLYDVFLEV
jgi:hypothetical protein